MPSLANFDGVKNSNGAVVSRGSNKQLQGEKENSCLGKRQLDVSREKQPHIIGLQSDFISNNKFIKQGWVQIHLNQGSIKKFCVVPYFV